MREFLQINKSKLKFAFIFSSLVFSGLVLIIFAIGFFNQQIPEISLFLTVLLGAGLGMPLFIILIGTLRGTWDIRKRKRAFSSKPYSELKNFGFVEQLKNKNNRWQFSEHVLIGEICDYKILAEVDTQNAPNVIRFQAITEIENIGNDEIRRLTRKFEPYDIELDFDGVTKKIFIKDKRITTIDQLLNDLKNFIEIIKRENFKPKITGHNSVYTQ